jgi:hypothetical protein
MNKSVAINILARHALATLPQDEGGKVQLYSAIAAALPNTPEGKAAAHISASLVAVNHLQQDFLTKLGIQSHAPGNHITDTIKHFLKRLGIEA